MVDELFAASYRRNPLTSQYPPNNARARQCVFAGLERIGTSHARSAVDAGVEPRTQHVAPTVFILARPAAARHLGRVRQRQPTQLREKNPDAAKIPSSVK